MKAFGSCFTYHTSFTTVYTFTYHQSFISVLFTILPHSYFRTSLPATISRIMRAFRGCFIHHVLTGQGQTTFPPDHDGLQGRLPPLISFPIFLFLFTSLITRAFTGDFSWLLFNLFFPLVLSDFPRWGRPCNNFSLGALSPFFLVFLFPLEA